MLKIFNYEKPGRGVRENEPEKKGIFRYFEIIRCNIKSLIMLNVLFLITSIPVVTIGPSFAAMTSVLKSHVENEHSWGAADYFAAFKKHFKQGFSAGIINILFGYGFLHNFLYFAVSDGLFATYMAWLFAVLLVLFVIVHSYVYTLMVTVKESVLELYTDSFIMALAHLPKNLLGFAGTLVYPFVVCWLLLNGVLPVSASISLAGTLAVSTLFSFSQLAAVMYSSAIIKKYR